MKKILAALALLILVGLSASVAADAPRGGVTVSPAFQELVLNGDQPELKGSFTVTNNSDQPATFELSTVDMGALDDTGGLVFSGLPQDYQKKYGLAEWITLTETKLVVTPRATKQVGFLVKNEESLAPGGHYGAIIVRQIADQPQADQHINLSPQVASLLFLSKRGGEKYGLSLSDISADNSIRSLPTKADLEFKNVGNVHLVPRGVVRIKNTFGKEVAKGIINQDSSLILPERSRRLQIDLDTWGRNIWPGRYTIEVEYRYDGQENVERRSETFYTANLRILLFIIIGATTFVFVFYKAWKKTAKWRKSAIRNFAQKINKKIR